MPVSTMCAAVIHRLGPAESIDVEHVPVPRPGPGEVLVRVSASAVNHVDTFVRSGAYRTPMTFPFVVGRDLVGVVEAVGAGVDGVAASDPVWCNSLGHGGRQGAAAEFAIVPSERLYPVPAGVDPVNLVAIAHPAATAWLALVRHGGIRKGSTVFVGGGGGNVGAQAVSIALAAHARVVTTASAGDLPGLRLLGAEAFDYRDPHLEKRLAEALPSGADVWLDTSGTLRLPQTLALLAERGRVVLIAGIARHDEFTFGDLYTHDRGILGFAISNGSVGDLAAAADAIGALTSRLQLPVPPIERLPLDRAGWAHAELEAGRGRGRRIVLVPSLAAAQE